MNYGENNRVIGEDLVAQMPPQAIVDDVQLENTIEMIDALMASGKLTKGQASYMETLVQLVQAYEAAHHEVEIDPNNTKGRV